jgi:hypothetical protein
MANDALLNFETGCFIFQKSLGVGGRVISAIYRRCSSHLFNRLTKIALLVFVIWRPNFSFQAAVSSKMAANFPLKRQLNEICGSQSLSIHRWRCYLWPLIFL